MYAKWCKFNGWNSNKRNYEIWNICTNEKGYGALDNALTNFGPILIIYESKPT